MIHIKDDASAGRRRQVEAVDLCICHGGIMRIRRAIVSPLITFSIAGSVLAGTMVPLATTLASTSNAVSVVAAPHVYMQS